MKKIFKNTWGVLTKKEKKQSIMLGLMDIIISIIDILSLALLLWIIKFYIEPTHTSPVFLPKWLGHQDSVSFIA